jgi:hypothetical protein
MGAAACTNGIDDDGDGHVDCDDQDCDTVCTGGDSGVGPMTDAHFPDAGPPRDGSGCYDPIDVVFVLDVSTSMTEEFAHLRDGIASIVDAAHALTPDTGFAIVVFVDDVLAVDGCGVFDNAPALQDVFDHWRTFCATNGEPGGAPGGNGDCPENSLDALYVAATQCTWRAGATHIVIHVTDDTFLERPASFSGDGLGSGIPVQHTYDEVVTALTGAQIRVGAFAQRTPMFCGAGTSANTAQGFFDPYMGMTAIPEATGGRVWDIADVRAGTLDMASAIDDLIVAGHCAPF